MSFAATPEQEELRAVVRAFFASKSGETAVRALLEDERGYDADVWAQLSQQLGLTALVVPEAYGGAGYGIREAGVVFEEAGRALLCAPLLSSFLAVQTLLLADDEGAREQFLPGLAGGTTLGSVAWLTEYGALTVSDGRLSGSLSFVLDGHVADLLLVVAEGSLYAVRSSAEGFRATALTTLDPTRRQAVVELNNTPGQLIGAPGTASSVLDAVLQRACVVLAAEQVGGTAQALEMSVSYAKLRHQFGRPIGGFQAIKHTCADMYVLLESARSAVQYAVWAADDQPEELPLAASLASAFCTDAYSAVTAANVQVHGGIGFTWEHPAHLYLRRAKGSELLFGLPAEHRERAAQLVGL